MKITWDDLTFLAQQFYRLKNLRKVKINVQMWGLSYLDNFPVDEFTLE